MRIVRRRLETDDTLMERTNITTNAIMELLTVCVQTTYFQLEDKFYQQEFGMAMGSPLSPIMSNIYMENFEDEVINQSMSKPKMWLRYVDDTFVIWPHGTEKLNQFLESLNNHAPSIKFTMEVESNKQLPFLDVLVERDDDKLQTKVYRKATHTGRYLHYQSNHHKSVKIGIARCLYDRAKTICSKEEDLRDEEKRTIEVLRENGYPKLRNSQIRRSTHGTRETTEEGEQEKHSAVIPYIPGVSEQLRRVGNRYNIRTAFKSSRTLRELMIKTKPENEDQKTKNCVYSVPCQCGREYIGETSRPLRVRLQEHKSNINNGETDRSKIAEHVWEHYHQIDWDEAKILAKEENTTRRKLKEATYIALANQPISQASLEIKPIWMPILRQEQRRLPIPRGNPTAAQTPTAQPAHTPTAQLDTD